MSRLLQLLSLVVLALFAVMWLWMGFKLLGFDPTTEKPTLTFEDVR